MIKNTTFQLYFIDEGLENLYDLANRLTWKKGERGKQKTTLVSQQALHMYSTMQQETHLYDKDIY